MDEVCSRDDFDKTAYRVENNSDTEECTDSDDDPNLYSEEEHDFDNYYTVNSDGDEGTGIREQNKVLTHDLDMLKKIYGEQSFSIRLLAALDNLDVALKISMQFLYEEQAKAWCVNREEPLIVRLHLSMSAYLDEAEPMIEVFQPSRKEKFGIGSQLKKILESFISRQWKELSNAYVASQHLFPVPGLESKDEARKTKSPSESPLKLVDDATLARLVGMGFDLERSREALLEARGNEQEAVALLCGDDNASEGVTHRQEVPQDTVPKTDSGSRLKKLLNRGSASSKGRKPSKMTAVEENTCKTSSSASEGPIADHCNQAHKVLPGLEYGWLVQMMRYAQQRVPTMNEFCVVCDEPHEFQNGGMLKPAVCSRELCVFAYQTLGVMHYAAEEIASAAEVVDLMINMAKSACLSPRRDVIFDPYPTVVNPQIPTELAFNPKKKDFSSVISCFQCIPDMATMTQMSAVELKQSLDKANPVAYPLLQWVISSNRCHIVKLHTSKQLHFMNTPHQFLLLSSPPAKEAKFRAAKSKYGSTFAFHGSCIENWHSIIRKGLVNASGTKLQVVSTKKEQTPVGKTTSTKETSSQSSVSGQKFLSHSNRLSCIALCEVVTSEHLKKHGPIWVCPNPDHVCTRFFFVYEDHNGQVPDVHTQKEGFKQRIQDVAES
ncbi:poly [ADP-ribose] polymerase 6 [Lingula anatina]|uniref:Poly [ADP-ribose] polymerase 6 n=1 Tax=Lingula anatina TaxID=7574 RepID=A0A1S3H2N6_LINAN|nr:poly [ADP-ribose] polymerase 6 [Lingula anatina]|eukprot:XP_013379404.1 poly [ADP-ribose] polymerase 6 [Lingula anatina]